MRHAHTQARHAKGGWWRKAWACWYLHALPLVVEAPPVVSALQHRRAGGVGGDLAQRQPRATVGALVWHQHRLQRVGCGGCEPQRQVASQQLQRFGPLQVSGRCRSKRGWRQRHRPPTRLLRAQRLGERCQDLFAARHAAFNAFDVEVDAIAPGLVGFFASGQYFFALVVYDGASEGLE